MTQVLLLLVLLGGLCVSSALSQTEGTMSKPIAGGGTEWKNWTVKSVWYGAGKSVDRSQSLPVFWEFPNREYHVVGYVTEHGSEYGKRVGDPRVIGQLAGAAKVHGADAIIMMPLSERVRGMKQGGDVYVYAWAWAIKWGPAPL